MSLTKFIRDFLRGSSDLRKHDVTVDKRYDDLLLYRGPYNKISLKIKSTIREIFSNYDFNTCYIGATENLDERWSNYSKWELKHVLYETASLKNAELVEEKLIEYVKNKNYSCNKDDKSIGLKKGAEKYYVYILADYNCKPR